MVDTRQAELAVIALGALAASLLLLDACRHASHRGALEWRRGRLLEEAKHPGPFSLGLSLMQSVGLGFAFGAVRAATALLDIPP